MTLKEILADYPLEDGNLLMRESIRVKRRKTIRESHAPQSGAYWWFPQLSGNKLRWSVVEYFDSDHNDDTLHMDLWPHVLELLAIKWHKDVGALLRSLSNNYTGLPRGRVNAGRPELGSRLPASWTLLHGNDNPPGMSFDAVLKAFNLGNVARMDKVKYVFDHHEQMDPNDCECVQKMLGYDLGLKGVEQNFE